MIHARRLASTQWLSVLWSAALVATACGGGGTSGFDIQTEADSEQSAIALASESGSCVDFHGLGVCGPGSAVPASLFPTAPGEPAVIDLTTGSHTSIPCVPSPSGGCTISLQASQTGFPEGTTLAIAVRVQDDTSPWRAAGDPVAAPSSQSVTILVPLGLESGTRFQVGVLVYLPGQAPPSGTVHDALADFDPFVVYVLTDVTVQ